MTVHTQRIETRHRPFSLHGQLVLPYLAIAAVIALFAIVMIVVFSLIGPPGQDLPMTQQLSELRTSIGGGGFI